MEGKQLASSSSHQPNVISPSSGFKPKLNDQDYMELVCENGKILAKTRRPKNNGSFQNQRTQSLLDLYETEYYDGFKKNIKNLGDTQVVPVSEPPQPQQNKENNEQINNKKKIKSSKTESERNVSKSHKRVESSTLIDDSAKGPKNVEVTTAPPDEQSVAVGRSTELYFASSSKFSRGSSRDQSLSSLKRKHGDIEEEESTYLISNNSDDESDDEKTQVHVRTRKPVTKKRKRSTEVHRLSERKRRDEFNKKMRALQDLLPNCYKDDKASLLDEAIKYMRTLQLQVQMMSMGNGLIRPPTMLPMGHYSHPMGLGMHMGAAAATPVPQFLPMNVHGAGFPGMNNASSQMLSFLNHPTGLIPNSPIFSPLENCSQQFVVPSCLPQTQATSLTQFPKSASTSNLEDATQFRGSNGYYRSLN
ncbi:PREDICTED: transcription factor PIL1-like [Camelina sativa]|uniref:Transcription factor PIL1-like n=1 Tax=Camelina sativa TaxID=90675 RepID=A0ABM1RPQ7_CAMSA|nr:PREDICTED: transcription factor PIL1-like [Camelina sativa]